MKDSSNNNPSDKSNDYGDLNLKDLKSLGEERGIAAPENKRSKAAWAEALQKDDVKREGEIGDYLSDAQDKSDKLADKDTSQNTKAENETQQNPTATDSPKNLAQDSGKEADKEVGSAIAQETVFEDVINKLEQRGLDIDSLSLKFDGEEALSYKNGDVQNNFLTESQSDLLQSALQDPQNFQGSVTIKSGNRTILKIENGQVTRDSMRLTSKSMKLDVESGEKKLYDKYSKDVSSVGMEKSKDVVVGAIKDGVSRDDAKKMIRSQDKGFKDMAEKQGQEPAEKALNGIVNKAVSQAKLQESQPSKDQGQEQNQDQEKVLAQSR